MSKLLLIIKREFFSKVRNKTFIVMTFLSPLLAVGLSLFIGYLMSMKSDQKTIAIHDQSGLFVKEFKTDEETKYIDFTGVKLQTLKDSIVAERYDGLLVIPKTETNQSFESTIQYISNDSPNTIFLKKLETTISKKITNQNFQKLGLDTSAISKANAKISIALSKADGQKSLKGINEIKIGIGGAFGYLIMMFIIIYGNMVMRSVIEEKTSRIIEVIISSVKPFQLMMGKIIGTSLAGILQFLIWAVLGVTAMFILSSVFGVQSPSSSGQSLEVAKQQLGGDIWVYINELKNLPIATILGCFLIYFIGGYFLYSSFYAAIGAAVDNETDSQQFLLPVIMPLVLGVYIGFGSVLNDPHGTMATVFSMVPLTSPIVMMMRIPFGVPWYEIAISITILFTTFIGVVWFAAKIYRVGILMYGKKPTWGELIKWLRY
jgi:ABC-2 type transport system permease protein